MIASFSALAAHSKMSEPPVPLPGEFAALEPEPEPEPQFLTVEDVPAPGVRAFDASTSESSDDDDSNGGGGGGSESGEARLPGVEVHHVVASGAARPMTLAEVAAQSSTGRAAPVAPGTHLRCVKKAAVRAGFELESERLGFLEPGEEIEVLESCDNYRGQMRVRYEGGWTSIESAAGSVLLVHMQSDPTAPPPLSQWAAAGMANGCEPLDQDIDELELGSENPAFSAHLQEMELASRLLAEGGERAWLQSRVVCFVPDDLLQMLAHLGCCRYSLVPPQTTKRLLSALGRCSTGIPATTQPREGCGRLKRVFSSFCKRSCRNG